MLAKDVEVFKYDGDLINNKGEYYVPAWAKEAFEKGLLYYQETNDNDVVGLYVSMPGNDIRVSVGDYIIMSSDGVIFPCKPQIFEKIYQKSDDYFCKSIDALTNIQGDLISSKLNFAKNVDFTPRKAVEKYKTYTTDEFGDLVCYDTSEQYAYLCNYKLVRGSYLELDIRNTLVYPLNKEDGDTPIEAIETLCVSLIK